MARKIRRLDDTPVDVFEAIKRARIRHGFIRRRGVSANDSGPALEETPRPSKKVSKDPEPSAEAPTADSPDEDPEKLLDITTNAQDVLFEGSTVFPFTLFPDTITLDREKLTIANRTFFRVAKIISIPISDIVNVQADVGPFFGSIHVSSRNLNMNPNSLPYSVSFLTRQETMRIHRLLQGYVIAFQRDVDCSSIEKEQLIILLNDLGQGVSD